MRVGFIGLGNMGTAAARNLQRAGHDLFVYDVRADAGADVLANGGQWCASPAEVVSRSEAVFTMVFGPDQIAEVMRGADGLLAGDCSDRVWIDMTTSRPSLMRELGAEFEAAGGLAVDAPVTGSLDSCIRGDMILFVGGSDAAVDRARPLLDAVGVPRRVSPRASLSSSRPSVERTLPLRAVITVMMYSFCESFLRLSPAATGLFPFVGKSFCSAPLAR